MMLLFAAHALYVGNNACSPCHAEIIKSYAATPMARTSGAVQGGVTGGVFRHEDSKTDYRVAPSGLVTATRGVSQMQQQLNYFIGSGAAGKSYLYAKDRFLFQAPVTWYSPQGRWDVSPGYEKDNVSRWNRPIEPECLNCHASQIRFSPSYRNRYATPPFAQEGVGCERCHGPGSDHVQGKAKLLKCLLPSRRRSNRPRKTWCMSPLHPERSRTRCMGCSVPSMSFSSQQRRGQELLPEVLSVRWLRLPASIISSRRRSDVEIHLIRFAPRSTVSASSAMPKTFSRCAVR